MKKIASILSGALAAGLGLAALQGTQSLASDHLDSTTLAGNPMADINDVYTWVTGTKLNLIMTISPADPGTRTFGTSVQYAFHLTSKASLADVGNPTTGTDTTVICTFASNTSAQCWLVAASGAVIDYLKGDPSNPATGVMSADGKMKLFAGRRSDPFFFNLSGFRAAVAAVEQFAATAPPSAFDAAGCPIGVDATIGAQLRGALAAATFPASPPCPANTADCFAALDVMSIVVQVDTSLVNSASNTILAVWGSTHQGS